MPKKYLIAYCSPHSGLCNRLNCIISATHGGEIMNREVLIYWPRGYNCDIHLNELINIDNVREIESKEFKRAKKKLTIHDYSFKEIPLEEFVILSTSKFVHFPMKGFKNKEVIKKNLKKIHPKEEIVKKIDELNKIYNFNELVGIHLRKGDWEYTSYGIMNISSEENFEEEIKKILKINPSQKFLLCTGSKKTECKFIKKFGNKIIVIPKHSQEFIDPNYKGGPIQIKEALIDLMSLSKTKFILGTWGSSFTEMAWRISGNSKQKIKLVGEEKKENIQKIKELEKVPNSLISKIFSKLSSELSIRFTLFRKIKFFIRAKRIKRRIF